MSKWLTLLVAVTLFCGAAWADTQKTVLPRVTGATKNALGVLLVGVGLELRASDGGLIARTKSDAHGRFSFNRIAPGTYSIVAQRTSFKPATTLVTVSSDEKQVDIYLESTRPLTVQLSARRLNRERNDLSPETGGSVYRFSEVTIKELPEGENTSLRKVLLQAPGVTPDTSENGGFHIRAADGQVQYRINGVTLPELSSAVTPIFSPRFAHSIALLDGTLPAQFGDRTAGVIDIHTKSGCLDGTSNLSMYGGQRATYQPSFELTGCRSDWDFYLTGQFLQTDVGVEPPNKGPHANHDFTQQGEGFAYISRMLSPVSRLTLMTGLAVGHFQIPTNPALVPKFKLQGNSYYAPSAINDAQLDRTYYSIFAFQGSLGSATDYQLSAFNRYFRSDFSPDPIGDLIYAGVASRIRNSSFANGAQGDFTYRLHHSHTLRSGFYFNAETVGSDNTSAVFPVSSDGSQEFPYRPELIVDNANKLTLLGGVYLQDEWTITRKLTANVGMRWDISDAFVSANDFQPRVGVVYYFSDDIALHAGYSRYFTPPPLEQITHKTVAKFDGTSNAVPDIGNEKVKPQHDDYFDAGIVRQITPRAKVGIDGYFDLSHQWLDQAQLGNSLVFSPLNFRDARRWGAEVSSGYDGGAYSAWLNFSYGVAQVSKVSSMQFAIEPEELAYIDRHFIPNDQTQLFTVSFGGVYHWRDWGFSVDATWNRGLPAGFANQDTLSSYLTVNAGVIRDFDIADIGDVKGRAVMTNVFDRVYLVRGGNGLDVNSPSYGPRRAVYLGLTVPLPFTPSANSQSRP